MKSNCEITHSQIAQGTCPWCGNTVNAGADGTQVSNERIWDRAAMTAVLDDPSEQIRLTTVTNLFLKCDAMDVVVPLLSKALFRHFREGLQPHGPRPHSPRQGDEG
jgi:hypothetical protein